MPATPVGPSSVAPVSEVVALGMSSASPSTYRAITTSV